MLDAKDMEMLKAYFDPKFDALNRRMDSMEMRIGALEKRMDAMEKRMDAMEKRMDAMEKRMDAMEKHMQETDAKIDARTDLLLNEIELLRNAHDHRIDKIQESVNDLIQYYRIKKLDDSNNELLLPRVDKLDERVSKLEERQTA